jgi:hypothetical protein
LIVRYWRIIGVWAKLLLPLSIFRLGNLPAKTRPFHLGSFPAPEVTFRHQLARATASVEQRKGSHVAAQGLGSLDNCAEFWRPFHQQLDMVPPGFLRLEINPFLDQLGHSAPRSGDEAAIILGKRLRQITSEAIPHALSDEVVRAVVVVHARREMGVVFAWACHKRFRGGQQDYHRIGPRIPSASSSRACALNRVRFVSTRRSSGVKIIVNKDIRGPATRRTSDPINSSSLTRLRQGEHRLNTTLGQVKSSAGECWGTVNVPPLKGFACQE